MHVDVVLLIGLPLVALGAVFFRASRREAARQRERAAVSETRS